ncbi:MAG: 16S rRNA (guanine(527)-N(7))-methyltransferase RsmG [Magnetococcales bacterium]|nr:16S rRNA (guanine(527)-N(7))-methyltransferase RsmG [Magnetococcales bacterium]
MSNTISNSAWDHFYTQTQTIIDRDLTPMERNQFVELMSHLLQWRKAYNLIGPTPPEEILDRHFLDSILVHPHIKVAVKVADLGSGGGFPGLVLGILAPDNQTISLIEPSKKKVRFLNFITTELDLGKRIRVFNKRGEELPAVELGSFDIVVSRALGNLEMCTQISRKLLKPTGFYLTMKGPNFQQEIDQFEQSPQKAGYGTPEICSNRRSAPSRTVLIRVPRVSRETSSAPET